MKNFPWPAMKPEEAATCISVRHDRRPDTTPDASLVIVTYKAGHKLLELLGSLDEQSCSSFETIIVDNGGNEAMVETLKARPLLYLKSTRNSLSFGRNLGGVLARAEVLIFLDDDCLADRHLVAAHLACHVTPGLLMARGKALPKGKPLFHHFQGHYDLGPVQVPAVNSLEGNSSIKRTVLHEVGGFNPELFGAEGLDLSFRVARRYPEPGALVYTPEAIIYHDYAKGLGDYLEKCFRQVRMRKLAADLHPDIIRFAASFGPYRPPVRHYRSGFERLAKKIVGLMGTLAETLGRCTA